MITRGFAKISARTDCTEISPYISTMNLSPKIEYDWLLGSEKKLYVRIGHNLEKKDLHKFCTNCPRFVPLNRRLGQVHL